jgi:hypothetical protein
MAGLSHEKLDVAKCRIAIDQVDPFEHDAPSFT